MNNSSITMRKRWKKCEVIANHLNISKNIVYNIYSHFVDLGIAQKLLKGEPEAIKKAKCWMSRHHYYGKKVARTALQLQQNRPIAVANGQTPFNKEGIQDFKLVLWAINTIDDPERAKTALERALRLLNEQTHTAATT